VTRLAILGASGHGRVLADTAECCGWSSVQFFDDAWPGLQFNHTWVVCGDSSALLERISQFDGVLVAIGDNRTRQAKLRELLAAGARLATLIHPSAVVSRYATIEPGSVVLAGAMVNVGVRMGLGTILNTGCSVDHDCVLGAAVHISPGARLAGGVCVGDLTWVGIGASVRQSIRLGEGVMVGAGAAVVADVADGVTVVGVPARVRL
jgi:sugar O-acyltransferase (sialic acid O-acetyltransferase NeuD family)